MLISEINNREDVITSICRELGVVGIKIRSEKHKNLNNKRRSKKIFSVSLHLLELDDGLLSNGSVAQIPKFVLMACKRIQTELETEGLFRKTGSVKKQKMIQDHLEKGGVLDKSHHVVDIANLLKTFFRELPEALIPPGAIQEGLLRSLFQFSSYEEKCEALLMLMLLLPPISINTLAYFLQFLEVVIKNSHLNLMTTDNLVKVLTPTIMPVPLNAPQKRLTSHFKVIELLIENANLLGVVPDRMCKKENIPAPMLLALTEEQKKKKRRSGSLNRVFHGFRKIVGAIGSSENLDKSEELLEEVTVATPAPKSSKKRAVEYMNLSSKKKKDVLMTLTSLPEIDDPNSPSCKKETKRKSYGYQADKEGISPTKRRWSIVGGKFAKSKTATVTSNPQVDQEQPESVQMPSNQFDEDYVKISKSEYEAFKDRLVSIETKISHEFNMTKLDAVKGEMGQDDSMMLNGPQKVQNKYNQTLHEVEKLEDSERNTDHLAKRLSRDLKIRTSIDHAIHRSPSARKIGSLRRRRDSSNRLSRTQSWHLGQTSPGPLVKRLDETTKFVPTSSFYPKSNLKRAKPVQVTVHPSIPRPLPALPAEQPEKIVPEKPLRVKRESIDNFATPMKITTKQPENWTPATDFFNEPSQAMEVDTEKPQLDEMFFKTPVRPKRLSSSRSTAKNENDFVKTPMLPPRITPAKKFTPSSATPLRSMNFSATNKNLLLTPLLDDSSQGRESIIILRNKNAGMVAQKAKLFDGMSDKSVEKSVKIPRVIINKNLENVRNMCFDDTPSKNRQNVPAKSPRRSSRSPGGINKRFKSTNQSPILRTIREASEIQKAKLLKPEILNEIASPKRKDEYRKPLSQSNTPRRVKTPNSGKKRRPTKSPRFVRRELSTDSC